MDTMAHCIGRKLIGVIMHHRQKKKSYLPEGFDAYSRNLSRGEAVNDDAMTMMCAIGVRSRHFNAIGNIIETHLHVLFIGS